MQPVATYDTGDDILVSFQVIPQKQVILGVDLSHVYVYTYTQPHTNDRNIGRWSFHREFVDDIEANKFPYANLKTLAVRCDKPADDSMVFCISTDAPRLVLYVLANGGGKWSCQRVHTFTSIQHKESITALAFSRSEARLLASGDGYGTVCLWSLSPHTISSAVSNS